MQNIVKIAVAILVPLIILFVLFPDQGSARLDTVIRNAILMAYMNGYADALELKTEEIKKLKTSEKLFRKRIEQAAADYIVTVENMNK